MNVINITNISRILCLAGLLRVSRRHMPGCAAEAEHTFAWWVSNHGNWFMTAEFLLQAGQRTVKRSVKMWASFLQLEFKSCTGLAATDATQSRVQTVLRPLCVFWVGRQNGPNCSKFILQATELKIYKTQQIGCGWKPQDPDLTVDSYVCHLTAAVSFFFRVWPMSSIVVIGTSEVNSVYFIMHLIKKWINGY